MNKEYSLTSVGLVGYGSMGSAIARAVVGSPELGQRFCMKVYAKKTTSNNTATVAFAQNLHDLVRDSHILIIAVRPEQVAGVLQELTAIAKEEPGPRQKILVSIAAGVTLEALNAQTGDTFAVVRVMPNTLVEVGKGLFGFCGAEGLTPEQKNLVLDLFNGLGAVIEFDEGKMNAFTALAGCGPGMLFHIMDSFCEAGVSIGLTRGASRNIAVSLMAGCGLLAEHTGRSPVILREQSTSPAGMTIAGLNHMDKSGTRGHLIEAVKIALVQGEAMDAQQRGQR